MKNMMKKVMLTMLAFVVGLGIVPMQNVVITHAAEVSTKIPHTKTSGDSNYFTFAPNAWETGNDLHTWSKGVSASLPAQDIWYEVEFVGHKIDVYSGKNHPMSKVDYYIDDEFKGTYDLYNATNINSTLIATYEVDGEGPHTFKAVANSNNATGKLIDCAEVVVYHEPYTTTDITLNETTISLAKGATKQIAYTVAPDYADGSDLVFVSNDDKVATVNASGLITATGEGSCEITIYNATVNKKVTVNVQGALDVASATIVSTDKQYTQARYDDVKDLADLSATLNAWKNDTAISEFVIVSKASALTNVTISASDLSDGTNVIDKANVNTSFIKSTKAYNGGYLGYGSKDRVIPADNGTNRSESNDIVSNVDTINVAHQKLQPVLVEISIPENAVAGTYTTTISIDADELETPIQLTYSVNVADATLPSASEWKESYDIELWQYPYSSAEYYGVEPFSAEHKEILKALLQIYKDAGGHAITATCVEEAWNGQTYSANEIHYPSMIKWEKVNGEMTYDYTDFDAWISLCKEMGLADVITVYGLGAWHFSFNWWENGNLVYESWNGSVGSTRYNEVVAHFLTDFIAHLEEKGWKDDVYMGFDERAFSAAALNAIDAVVGSDGKPLKTGGDMDGFVNKWDLALRIHKLNVGDNAAAEHAAKFSELLEIRAEKGLKTTLYSCTEHRPGNFNLSHPVESYASAINPGEYTKGFARWAYDAWVKDPLTDATHNSFEPGDCFVVYPSDTEDDTNILRSMRLVKFVEGIRDVNKLYVIKSEVTDLADDVADLYASNDINYISGQRSYLSDAQVQPYINEMNEFKTGVEELTTAYVEAKANGTTSVESIAISGATTVTVGKTTQLVASLQPSTLLNKNVTWSSSDEKLATVNADGVVKGIAEGTVTISATAKADASKVATYTVYVVGSTISEDAQVAYYSFDENNANDAWGTRNGTSASGVKYVAGKSGKAASLTADSNITFTQDAPFTTEDDWTVGYWVYPTVEITDQFSVMMDKDKDFAFSLKMAADRSAGFRVGKNSGDVLTYTYEFEPNTWYHITWTQSRKDGLSMYVNGTLVQINNWTTNHTLECPIEIFGGTGFEGYLDEVKIYNTCLDIAQVNMMMLVQGVNLAESSATLSMGEGKQIIASLEGYDSIKDATWTYTSSNPSVAVVDGNGLVSALSYGQAVITVTNVETGLQATFTVNVSLPIANTLTKYQLADEYLSDVEGPYADASHPRTYLGQPDMVRTRTGKLITVFPTGHGHGPLIMKTSNDEGETWVEHTNIPTSWADSQETPTLYCLNMADGSERIVLICACPGSWGNYTTGWDMSYSDDDGVTWTEFEHFHSNKPDGSKNDCIVGMASLIQLKDEDGNYIQKWMGVYHSYQYVNYKSYLTFDEEGNPNWSEPEAYLADYRSFESAHQMCEVGMFRSPDGKRIVALARNQTHAGPATMTYSDDEGETWAKPVELPGSLAGERHKALYDPISGRLIITMREIVYDIDGNGKYGNDWLAGDWVAWVGTYEDLMALKDGDYMIVLEEDWSNNAKSGDTGYSGMVMLEDGTLITDSYGHWDKEYSQSYRDSATGGYNVKTDLCWIKQAKFKLGEFENDNNLVDRSELARLITKYEALDETKYTAETYADLEAVLEKANSVNTDDYSQQVEVDAVVEDLNLAYLSLDYASSSTVDKTTLKEVIKQAEKVETDNYTEATVTTFTAALETANAVNDKADATQVEVNNAKNALLDAMNALEAKPVDKTTLAAKLEEANGYDGTMYTSASFTILTNAIASATNVYANSKATQVEVNNAIVLLNAAIDQLVERTVIPPLNEANLINTEANKDSVSVVGFSSQCGGNTGVNENGWGEAFRTLDYNNESYWHSNWRTNNGEEHWISYDLGKTHNVSDVQFLARQNGVNGDIFEIKVYVSEDETITEDDYVNNYAFEYEGYNLLDRSEFKRAHLGEEVTGRYVKVAVVHSGGDSGNDKFASMAEIRFYGSEKASGPVLVNKEALKAAIELAATTSTEGKTEASVNAFNVALKQARDVYGDANAGQDAVDAATTALTNAIKGLVDEEKPVEVDKEALKAAIESAKKVDTTNKTEDSVAALASALSVAQGVVDKEDATQDEVDAAKATLEAAVAGLKDKPVDPKPVMDFYDVQDKKAWFYGSVESAFTKGLMGATGKAPVNGKPFFEPDTAISRGMVATVLYRMAGQPKVEFKATFSDVTNPKLWYSTAITWASQAGVVSGYKDGNFGPDDNITRQDLAIMLRNYAKSCGLDTNVKVDFSAFKDGNKVVSYAQSAIAFCIDAKLMSGAKKADGVYLNPSDKATRAECAKMFSLLDDAIKAHNAK